MPNDKYANAREENKNPFRALKNLILLVLLIILLKLATLKWEKSRRRKGRFRGRDWNDLNVTLHIFFFFFCFFF